MRTFAQPKHQPQPPASSRVDLRATRIPPLPLTTATQAEQRRLPSPAEEPQARSAGAPSSRCGYDLSGLPLHPPAASGLQTKLAIGKPGDVDEQEADRISERVMGMPAPVLQRSCANSGPDDATSPTRMQDEQEELVHRKATGLAPTFGHSVPARFLTALGPGQPLDPASRSFFEPRFHHDFSNVRIHADARAAESARSIHARAYTIGHRIVFGTGELHPQTYEGRLLLAHELTHTMQQEESSEAGQQIQRTVGDGHDLQATRFISPSRNRILEAAFDPGDRVVIQKPDNGPHVKLLQESLLAMGYALPAFGADGEFGDETEAAIIQFQRDGRAAKIDGIVGPETMDLFNTHDPTRPGGRPPQRTGPVPSPLPLPAKGCDALYNGVSFALSNQVARGTSPAAKFFFFVGPRNRPRGLNIKGTAPVQYAPGVEITAPSQAVAQGFEVGFASNCLVDTREYTYSNGMRLRSRVPTPIKDGSTTDYDPIYTKASGARSFTANGQKISLAFGDQPRDSAHGRLSDNPQCAGALSDGILTDVILRDEFRTWVVVRHKAGGCALGIHHIDWHTDWRATVSMAGGSPTITTVSNDIQVTTPNGDGKPPYIQGGPVLNDLLAPNRICGA